MSRPEETTNQVSELVSLQFHGSREPNSRNAEKIPRIELSNILPSTSFSTSNFNASKVSTSAKNIRNRELGLSSFMPNNCYASSRKWAVGQRDRDFKHIYSNLVQTSCWDPQKTVDHQHHGGAFGMDFSSDGSVLAVACENRSLLFFDASSGNLVNAISNAHTDCANCVRFLDDRLFASCSDDHMVKLWDLRNMKSNIRTMRGHHNWVKNIEFVQNKGLLLSSAFDHYVYAWDINDSQADQPKRLFYTPGLMRMRLTPGGDKMILSTQWGYMLVIHDLNISEMPRDLFGFKPNMYWLMIKCGQPFSSSAENMCRFTAKRNRTEIFLDFPEGCDPENVSSICPHPEGWCVASRSNNHDQRSEWTCIHDLQNPPMDEQETGSSEPNIEPVSSPAAVLLAEDSQEASSSSRIVENTESVSSTIRVERRPPRTARRRRGPENIIRLNVGDRSRARESDEPSSSSESENEQDGASQEGNGRQRENREDYGSYELSSQDVRLLLPSVPQGTDAGVRRRRIIRARRRRNFHLNLQSQQVSADISVNSGSLREPRAFFIRTGPPNSGNRTIVVLGGTTSPPLVQEPPESEQIGHRASSLPKTNSRLIYYKEEPRVGRGFIKEQSWTPDGRVLASPYAFGVRLLAFNRDCQEVNQLVPVRKAVNLREMTDIGMSVTHQSVVLCTKFSPVNYLLATGSHKGKVVFVQPRF